MSVKRIIFIPWRSNKGSGEGAAAATAWNKHAFEKKILTVLDSWEELAEDKYETVCFGDAKSARTWAADDQIYIKGGHCRPGSNVMKNYSGGYTLTADLVAQRLVSQFDLNAAFIGTIKLYTCDSAVPGGIYNFSFGEFFVREIKDICPRATIYGYKGTVSKTHDFKGSGDELHKGAEFKGVEKRASEYRYPLHTPKSA